MEPPITKEELEVLGSLARALSTPDHHVTGRIEFGEPLRRAVVLLKQYQHVSPAEERRAWDEYFGRMNAVMRDDDFVFDNEEAADVANRMLVARRKRFGSAQ